ncbi:MAG: tyrosine-type recombinase/integrase [Candidatus Izemoplasmataceae bacterium]
MKHPFESLRDQYLSELDITKGTYDLYCAVLTQYIGYLKKENIEFAKTGDIKAYITMKKEAGYSPSWLYHQVNTIKAFYKYLSRNQRRLELDEVYSHNIALTIKGIKVKSEIAKPILTKEEAKHLIIATKENRKTLKDYRDHAIIYLMLTTGMRTIEIRQAKIKDLKEISNKHVLYIQGKGKSMSDEFVKIPDGVFKALHEYLSKRTDTNPHLFISHAKNATNISLSRPFFFRLFKALKKKYAIKSNITPHSLRHTAATINLLRGASLEETKRLMRHKKLSTTLIYAHHLNQMYDEAESAIERFIFNEED